MSSGTLRGIFCLTVALAMFAGVGVWTFLHTKSPRPVESVAFVKSAKDPNQANVVVIQRQPKAKPPSTERIEAKPALPRDEEPAPFHEPPRFFQKFGGKGFGRSMPRSNLSERLGVRLEKPSEDAILQLGIAEADGLIVVDVRVGSVAESAGVKSGDILLTLDSQRVPSDVDEFHFQLENLKSNQAMDAVILRDGQTQTLKGLVLPEASPRFFPPRRFIN